MTYLELLQATLLLIRAGNEKLSDPPETVTGLSGVQYEVAQWIKQSCLDIQRHKSGWTFMREMATVVVQGGQRVVDIRGALTNLSELVPSTGDYDGRFITTYQNPGDSEIKCFYFPWETWRGSVFDRRPVSESSAPIRFTIRPDQQLEFDPTPSVAINVVFDYRRKPIALVNAGDVPAIPEEHHMAIVWWAVRRYYCLTRDKTQELRAKAGDELHREMTAMYNRFLPEITIGGAAP